MDGSAAIADMSHAHADRLAAELANTSRGGRKGDVVFAQSDEMTVIFSEDLPTEVRGVIERGGAHLFVRKKAELMSPLLNLPFHFHFHLNLYRRVGRIIFWRL